MITQLTCPHCGTPFQAEIHQMIDVGQQPELKMQLLNGALNVAACPNCGAGTQLSAPLVYHDAEHRTVYDSCAAGDECNASAARGDDRPFYAPGDGSDAARTASCLPLPAADDFDDADFYGKGAGDRRHH